MRAGTVAEVLDRAWRKRYPAKPEWAARLQPLHVRTWIVRRVAAFPDVRPAELAEAGSPGPALGDSPVPAMTAALPRERVRDLQRWLDDDRCWEIVALLGRLADGWAGAVETHLVTLDTRPPISAKAISEQACAVVGRPYAVEPALPATAYLDAERARCQDREQRRATRTHALPPPTEFAARYAGAYDELWSARGAAALAEASPIELGLGWLERPPMTVTGSTGGWRSGTDLPVRNRYARHLRARWSADPAAVAETADLDTRRHVGVRLLEMAPEQVCHDVVDRACAPLGLRLRPHRALLRSFVDGMRDADLQTTHDQPFAGRPPAALPGWAGADRDLPDLPDPQLVAAVAGHAEAWARRGGRTRELIDGLAGRGPYWPDQIVRGTSRKLWAATHSREVEWEAPLRRSEVAHLLPRMFGRHLTELFERPITPPAVPSIDAAAVPAPDDPRLLATLARLAADPWELSRLIAEGDPAWRQRFHAVVPPGDDVLTAEEFLPWALRYMAGDPSEDR